MKLPQMPPDPTTWTDRATLLAARRKAIAAAGHRAESWWRLLVGAVATAVALLGALMVVFAVAGPGYDDGGRSATSRALTGALGLGLLGVAALTGRVITRRGVEGWAVRRAWEQACNDVAVDDPRNTAAVSADLALLEDATDVAGVHRAAGWEDNKWVYAHLSLGMAGRLIPFSGGLMLLFLIGLAETADLAKHTFGPNNAALAACALVLCVPTWICLRLYRRVMRSTGPGQAAIDVRVQAAVGRLENGRRALAAERNEPYEPCPAPPEPKDFPVLFFAVRALGVAFVLLLIVLLHHQWALLPHH